MKTKQCNKCNKETKLAFKCEHCGAIQQWTMSEQLGFFKGLSNIKKGLYIGAFVIVATVSFQIFSGFETNSTSSRSSSSSKSTQKYHNVSGGSSSSISTCRTCGTSYTVASLPYGEYCSQSCCAAYEGVSSKCGY